MPITPTKRPPPSNSQGQYQSFSSQINGWTTDVNDNHNYLLISQFLHFEIIFKGRKQMVK